MQNLKELFKHVMCHVTCTWLRLHTDSVAVAVIQNELNPFLRNKNHYLANQKIIFGGIQVMFHVPTLMPNKPNDPACNAKKRHIGNDYVAIVYNNSGEEFDVSTIKVPLLTIHFCCSWLLNCL
jgi:hypothetical protein